MYVLYKLTNYGAYKLHSCKSKTECEYVLRDIFEQDKYYYMTHGNISKITEPCYRDDMLYCYMEGICNGFPSSQAMYVCCERGY